MCTDIYDATIRLFSAMDIWKQFSRNSVETMRLFYSGYQVFVKTETQGLFQKDQFQNPWIVAVDQAPKFYEFLCAQDIQCWILLRFLIFETES